jgi:hypothetical protein
MKSASQKVSILDVVRNPLAVTPMISSIDNLVAIFDKMSKDGWDIRSKLKWGFFFVDTDKGKLKAVYEELKEKDYVLESIYSSDESKWTLHASKVDTLTPEKLHRRNIAFNELDEYCSVELYDGWDVEKIK